MKGAVLAGAGLVLVVGAVTPVASGAAPVEAAGGSAMPFDLDGDGYADLAVGVPLEDLRGRRDAGAVQVLYGSASGPTTRDQVWHQGRKGVKGALERNDRFGDALASGDFDKDGYADLAVGIRTEDIGTKKNAGAVQVLYGGPAGLTATGDQVWHQGKKGVPGTNEKADCFGESLAVGDFDGDGYADLAIGSPSEDSNSPQDGRVVVLRGSAAGLTSSDAQQWGEWSAGIANEPQQYEYFGYLLASGDVNGDGRDDLTVAVNEHSASGVAVGDAVHLLLGSPTGLTGAGSQYVRLTDLGLAGGSEASSLWLRDVNADDRDDLTLGSDGGVAVLHGHADGFHPAPLAAPGQPGTDTIWSRESGYEGTAASGDLTNDGFADLALRDTDNAIGIVLGTSNGLGTDVISWPVRGRNIRPTALQVLPLSGGRSSWLVVGDVGDQPGSPARGGGTVTVLQGTPTGSPGPATVWSQDSRGIKGAAEAGDFFGRTVGGA